MVMAVVMEVETEEEIRNTLTNLLYYALLVHHNELVSDFVTYVKVLEILLFLFSFIVSQ